MANEKLPRFPSGVEVVSAIAGRVRLRATGQRTRAELEAVVPRLREQEGVREVRMNEQTGSVLIAFDPSTVTWSQLWGTLQQSGVSQAQTGSQEEHSALWLPALTEIQSLIPSLVAILVTRSLGLQGWSSIPPFLIVAGVSRQVMEKFNLGVPGVPTSEAFQDTSTENQALAHHVVKATPGRMRFHIREVAEDADYAQRVQRLAQADERITSVRLNRAIGSVVVTYESQRFSEAEMRSHLDELISVAGIAEESRGEAGETRARGDTEKQGKNKPTSHFSTEEHLQPAPEEANESEASEEETTQQPTLEGSRGAEKEQADGSHQQSRGAREHRNCNQFMPWSGFEGSTLLGMLNWMANSTPQKA